MIRSLPIVLALAACGDDGHPQPAQLELPGTSYYPESLSASADGTLYVGSLATGQVVAFHDGATDPEVVIPAQSNGITGVLVHGDELWVCAVDTTFTHPTEVRHHDLDGTLVASYPLAANQFCNDLAFDDAGALYATDSFSGTIQTLPPGASALATFHAEPAWQPASQGAFGLDGIAFVNGALYVSTLDTGTLFRVDVATAAVTPIAVDRALGSPDGLRVVDATTLEVIEGAGRLTRLAIDGDHATATTIADGLDQPTSVIRARGFAWVTEGQIGRLFAQPPQNPNLPFAVRRVDL